jgi:hypothetical protein
VTSALPTKLTPGFVPGVFSFAQHGVIVMPAQQAEAISRRRRLLRSSQ